jgi:lipoate synthase
MTLFDYLIDSNLKTVCNETVCNEILGNYTKKEDQLMTADFGTRPKRRYKIK